MLDLEEKKIIAEYVNELIKEKRRKRYWSLFVKGIVITVVVVILFSLGNKEFTSINFSKDHVALIKLEGVIFSDADASANNINQLLNEAYSNEYAKAVILEINTPGGSPVQSKRISDEVIRLRGKYPDKPLYAVVSDICASGGMYISSVADKVYSDEGSIIGSIGVISASFGFEEALNKLGIERRLLTAGENKGMLDPFSPRQASDTQHLQDILNQLHEQFINQVKKGREGKLVDDPDLFSGLFWTGIQAKELGLIDGFGDVRFVAEEIIKEDNIIEYAPPKQFLEELISKVSVTLSNHLLDAMLRSSLY